MRPKRLKKWTQQFAEDREGENDRATEHCDRDFKRGIKFQWSNSLKFCRSGNRGPERETGHETGQNQRRRPERITKREAAQPQPKRFKNQRADSRKKENNRKNRQSHRAIIAPSSPMSPRRLLKVHFLGDCVSLRVVVREERFSAA